MLMHLLQDDSAGINACSDDVYIQCQLLLML